MLQQHLQEDLVQNRRFPYFIPYIRSHTNLPGPLSEGNQNADSLTQIVTPVVVDLVQQAQASHTLHHKKSHVLSYHSSNPGRCKADCKIMSSLSLPCYFIHGNAP